MSETTDILDNLRVASPCRADWSRMEPTDGTNYVRFCRTCEKNVYNISMLSRDEAKAVLQAHEGDLCIRFAQRADGTLVTNDCPVGKRSMRDAKIISALILAMLTVVISNPIGFGLRRASAAVLRRVPAIAALENTPRGQTVFHWLDAPAPSPPVQVFQGMNA